ncbi:MAG: transporter substrate-binding domain-containing protein [Alphaproteobacteria bacterium]|nr:transporter substrate-binding domain-containing protein [Alphaproteobacteria bacterium]
MVRNIFLSLILCLVSVSSYAAYAADKESAYDRVMRTNILRCAYGLTGDAVEKTPVSGDMSGYTVDIVNAMAAEIGWTVEWQDEVGYGDFAEGLTSGRYDAFCGAMVASSARARVAKFTRPYMGYLTFAYVRGDENRFSSYLDIDNPNIKAGVTDGEIYQILSRKYFPKAVEVSSPNMTPPSQLFMDLEYGKVDVVVHNPGAAIPFDKMHPGKIKRVLLTPLGITAPGFAVGSHEGDLRDVLDIALVQLQNLGVIDSILDKYGYDDTQMYRLSPLFDVPNDMAGEN